MSTPGERDGLYWATEGDEPPSPFGELIDRAGAYLETKEKGDAVLGYHFAILTKQGANAPGGAYDYRVGEHMVRGFGLVAWPEDYEITGVMTFVTNQRGTVYQADLGQISGLDELDAFDPDDRWSIVEPPDDDG